MINPEKVLGFLDLFGQWDPSLIFVMIGAIIVSAPVFFLFRNKNKPFTLLILFHLLKTQTQFNIWIHSNPTHTQK
jgi:uncharacterized membrane protein YedE/YeeE